MTGGEDETKLLSFLQRLLEQPESPFHRRFDALTIDQTAVALCRKCQATIRAREHDASRPSIWNTSTQRWHSVLRQHLATHTAIS